MQSLGEEISYKQGGIIEKRANLVLDQAYQLLKEIEKQGLFKTIEKGIFAGIKRQLDGGKGLDGVFEKDPAYFNPFIDSMNVKSDGGN
jgi:beta-lysine 5,6-aminomutase alpha subunit